MARNTESWLPYAGVGGITICCLGLELLGGTATLSGLAATVGLSSGLTSATVVGLGGLLATVFAAGYQYTGEITRA